MAGVPLCFFHGCSHLLCTAGQKRSQRALQYLTSSTLNHDLGHVNDTAQGLDVISLPAADGFRQDLQLQLLPFPHVLTLGLIDIEYS